MPPTVTFLHWTKLWRVINACVVALVLSYVVFDLLDLGILNCFLRWEPDREPALLVSETLALGDSGCCQTDANLANQQTVEQKDGSPPSDHVTFTSPPLLSALWFLRAHGYRSGLPRSSPPG